MSENFPAILPAIPALSPIIPLNLVFMSENFPAILPAIPALSPIIPLNLVCMSENIPAFVPVLLPITDPLQLSVVQLFSLIKLVILTVKFFNAKPIAKSIFLAAVIHGCGT